MVPTFASFVEEKYLPYAKERIKPYSDHEGLYSLHLKAMWEKYRVDEIEPHHVAQMQDSLRREGLSNATVNRYTAFLRRVMNIAVRFHVLTQNPTQHAEIRRETHRETYLRTAEIRALFKALDSEHNKIAAGVIALLAATGARRGEAMAARWEHIDMIGASGRYRS